METHFQLPHATPQLPPFMFAVYDEDEDWMENEENWDRPWDDEEEEEEDDWVEEEDDDEVEDSDDDDDDWDDPDDAADEEIEDE